MCWSTSWSMHVRSGDVQPMPTNAFMDAIDMDSMKGYRCYCSQVTPLAEMTNKVLTCAWGQWSNEGASVHQPTN